MVATAATVSRRKATHSVIRTATTGMYSSAIPKVLDAAPNANMPAKIINPTLWPNRVSIHPRNASMAPVRLMTASTPPTIRTKKMMPCASARARGMTVNKSNGLSVRASSTSLNVPGTTARLPSTKSKLPAGKIQVAISATTIMPNSSTSVWGTRMVPISGSSHKARWLPQSLHRRHRVCGTVHRRQQLPHRHDG